MLRKPFAALLALFALLLAAPVAQASTASADFPKPVRAALDHLRQTGRLTAEEKATIRAYPQIAAQVADPDAPGQAFASGGSLNGTAAPFTVQEGGTGSYNFGVGCSWTDTWVRKVSLLGATQFVYHGRIDYCANGSAVTSVHNMYHYLSEADSTVNLRGYIDGSPAANPGGWRADARVHGYIELCVLKYGCYASLYPRVDLVIYGNGHADWSAWV